MRRADALGAVAVALGVWEAAAFAGVACPVSRAYAAIRRRWRRQAELGLALWLIWQALHLTRYD